MLLKHCKLPFIYPLAHLSIPYKALIPCPSTYALFLPPLPQPSLHLNCSPLSFISFLFPSSYQLLMSSPSHHSLHFYPPPLNYHFVSAIMLTPLASLLHSPFHPLLHLCTHPSTSPFISMHALSSTSQVSSIPPLILLYYIHDYTLCFAFV